MMNFARYYSMVFDWAEEDARYIRRNGNSGRNHWQGIRFRCIDGWKLSFEEKQELKEMYTCQIKKLAPVVIPKAPDKPRIAVSMC